MPVACRDAHSAADAHAVNPHRVPQTALSIYRHTWYANVVHSKFGLHKLCELVLIRATPLPIKKSGHELLYLLFLFADENHEARFMLVKKLEASKVDYSSKDKGFNARGVGTFTIPTIYLLYTSLL